MSREILFRGKRTDNGEWAYGDLLHPDLYGNGYSIEDFTKGKNNCCDVIPETIGQYTGLTDKNDKCIFEEDIISIPFEEDGSPYEENCTYYENGEVYFDAEHHGWYVKFSDGESLSIWEYDELDVVVIGNIYDNPELLEVGNE